MPESWRLTFARKGDGYVAQSVQRIEGRTAGGVWIDRDSGRNAGRLTKPQPGRETVGRFVELRDGEGRTLYRRAITQSLPDTLEYPTGNADSPLGRIPMPEGRLVSVRVPGDERARSAVIVDARAAETRRRRGAPVEGPPRIETRDLVEVELRAAGEGEAR